MQMSTKENGNLVRVNGGSSYPGFELTTLYCRMLKFANFWPKSNTSLQRRNKIPPERVSSVMPN